MNIASKSLVLFMLGFFMSGCAGQTSFRMPTVPLLSTDNESAQAINTSRSLLGERRIAETSSFMFRVYLQLGFLPYLSNRLKTLISED
jgi:hypothetical protein